MNAVIIDDEKDAIEVLESTLGSFCPEVNIVGKASSIQGGIDTLYHVKPDLVFLDVQMPGGTGFDVLDNTRDLNFKTVFVSAHENYAVQAVKFHAMDYLLKPVDPEEVRQTVMSLEPSSEEALQLQYQAILEMMVKTNPKKIAIPTGKGYRYFEPKQIIRVEASKNYSYVHVEQEDKPILVSRNLKQFETLFKKYSFIRIHSKHLINPSHILEYVRSDGGYIKLEKGEEFLIGPNFRQQLLDYLDRNSERF